MKRGRLVKRSDRSDYIYEYDRNGDIRHIVMPNCHATTYCLEEGNVQLRITYEDYNNQRNPEILASTIELKDPNGRTLCFIELQWILNMKIASEVNIEVYDIKQSTCCWINAVADLTGGYKIFEIYNCLLKYDEKMKLIDYSSL